MTLVKAIRTGKTGDECKQGYLVGGDSEPDKNICNRLKVPDEPRAQRSNIHT
jgi:hypothetical protein